MGEFSIPVGGERVACAVVECETKSCIDCESGRPGLAAAIPLERGLGVVFARVGEIDEFFDAVFGPLEIDVVTCEGGDTAKGVNAGVAGAGAGVALHHHGMQ